MKTLKTLLPLTCFLLLPLTAIATPIAYPFRVTDNSGILVAGATVAIGATTLTSGSATVTPAAAGEKLLATNAAPAATVSVTLLDYGTGDYALVYDPAVSGELYIPLTVSKSGSTITGGAALIALVASADSSTIVGVNTKTALIATNAMDSPNEITSQGQAGTTSTAVAALPAADATAVWGAATKTVTGGNVGTIGTLAPPANWNLALIDGAGKGTFNNTTIATATTVTNPVVASSVTGAVGSVTGAIVLPSTAPTTFLSADATASAIQTQTTAANQQAADTAASVALGYTSARGIKLDNLDAFVSSRMATFVYTAPTAAPTVPQIAAGILLTPANLLSTDATNRVTTSNPATGGSTVTEASIWTYGTRVLTGLGTTAPPWYLAPPSAPSDYLSASEQSSLNAAATGTPAAILAAIKTDSLFNVLLNRQKQRFSYVPSTHSYQPLLDDGVTLFGSAIILTVDSNGNITNR